MASLKIFNDAGVRAVTYQIALGVVLASVFYFLISNTVTNLERQGIASGFGFLGQEAGYVVGESFIKHTGHAKFGEVFLIGLLNTVYVSAVAIVFSTVCGILLGLARTSSNWLIARLCAGYILLFRNIPLLLQIVFWYSLLRQLPAPRQALEPVPGFFLSNRGLTIPSVNWQPFHLWAIAGFVLCVGLAFLAWRMVRDRGYTGIKPSGFALIVAIVALALPVVLWRYLDAPQILDIPVLQGFNFRGGTTFTPEFVGLLTAIVVYNTAFIGEIVRSGVEAIGRGQTEAASSIGFRPLQVTRYVVMPQAMRVIIPPVTNQYLNIVKDSSLAVWIGYPDLVAVATTAINLTGQVIEPLFIIMLAYLSISLTLSLIMNWYNNKMALQAR